MDETEEALTAIVVTEKYGKRELCSHLLGDSENGNQLWSGYRARSLKNRKAGARSRKRNRLFAFVSL
jgi:hypothetical protein